MRASERASDATRASDAIALAMRKQCACDDECTLTVTHISKIKKKHASISTSLNIKKETILFCFRLSLGVVYTNIIFYSLKSKVYLE